MQSNSALGLTTTDVYGQSYELAELLSKKDEVTDLRRMVDTLRMHGGSGGGALLQPSPHTSYYRGGDANDGGGATARVFHRRSSPLR